MPWILPQLKMSCLSPLSTTPAAHPSPPLAAPIDGHARYWLLCSANLAWSCLSPGVVRMRGPFFGRASAPTPFESRWRTYFGRTSQARTAMSSRLRRSTSRDHRCPRGYFNLSDVPPPQGHPPSTTHVRT